MLPSPEYDNVRAYHAIAETLTDDKWAAQRPSRG
jgi:hypothetical protein